MTKTLEHSKLCLHLDSPGNLASINLLLTVDVWETQHQVSQPVNCRQQSFAPNKTL